MNLKEFVQKNNLVAFDATSYVSCSCCCIGHYPTQIATLNENGVPVPISKELYDEFCRMIGTKLQHGQVNSLVKNGVLWFVDHREAKEKGYNHEKITKEKISKLPQECIDILEPERRM